MSREDEDLAYGEYHGEQERGHHEGGGFFSDIKSGLKHLKSEIKEHIEGEGKPTTNFLGGSSASSHRYGSFVSPKPGNDVKWYVDGCGYMYAVSRAIEAATESIWILDWWLTPELYLRRPPAKNEQYRLDRMLKAAAERGVKISIIVYKEVTQALTLSSSHTKHALEDLHPNITVLRHPDHLPDRQTFTSSIISSFQNLKLDASSISKLSGDTLKSIYGLTDDVILYWAHHEKLCLIDGQIAFMGGLDLCFGRWDTNQHPIADAHPSDLKEIVFPGQDYNNARIADFDDVAHWDQNKLDRKQSSRMGWSDISISLHGPCVGDLRRHFVDRWNFIFEEKYNVRSEPRYYKLSLDGHTYDHPSQEPESYPHHFRHRMREFEEQFEGQAYDIRRRFGNHFYQGAGNMPCQLVRSCTKWSNGTPTEHSIQNAYIDVILNSEHFVYIENQFFITATGDKQKPVENQIGKALVDRILRAARSGQKFKVIVMIPSVPAFAGDLREDSALGTRAIMEFQYNSINRGHGHSIMERIQAEGFDPAEYIRFFNLRNYDRINAGLAMRQAEEKSGVDYEEARMSYDNTVGAGYGGRGEQYGNQYADDSRYQQYQQATQYVDNKSKRWDSVSECYMLNGEDIRNVPWDAPGDVPEIDAFVSEELYIHSKVLIADDRIVICGSANLNDRSQLGTHDSEIALVIEDPTPVDSMMNGRPYQASRFAASLRRQLFRKHLGLLAPQDMEKPDANFEPVGVPNEYDWGSEPDRFVEDPLSDEFLSTWNDRARTNTGIFRQIFHPVPDDNVRTWEDYDKFYETYFKKTEQKGDGKTSEKKSKYEWGHVIRENFAPGEEGLWQVKALLSQIKGTLVEMPLNFLDKEDVAKSGASLNAITEPVYT